METWAKLFLTIIVGLICFGIYDNVKHPCNSAITPGRAAVIEQCINTPNCRIDTNELRQLNTYNKLQCKNEQ